MMIHVEADTFRRDRPAFGIWLLGQTSRDDAVGRLALAAAADRGFPRHGTADAISCRLNALGADGAMHEALEEAELDWAAY